MDSDDGYPFNVPAIRHFSRIEFTAPITLFIGENGSGKSTLLEAMALSVGSVVIGREDVNRDETLRAVKPLGDRMKLVWNKRTRRGFFMRAEDFFGFVQRTRSMHAEMMEEINRIDRQYIGRSDYAKTLAKGPATSSLSALTQRYGHDLDANSHGEMFLTVFQSRFIPGGLYLLDEPEAALSPLRQMGLISLIKQMILQGAQFIIATHSPILMAFPGAKILDFDQQPPLYVDFDEVEQVKLYRSFLEDPDAFVRRL
jgi:predicted ATPase